MPTYHVAKIRIILSSAAGALRRCGVSIDRMGCSINISCVLSTHRVREGVTQRALAHRNKEAFEPESRVVKRIFSEVGILRHGGNGKSDIVPWRERPGGRYRRDTCGKSYRRVIRYARCSNRGLSVRISGPPSAYCFRAPVDWYQINNDGAVRTRCGIGGISAFSEWRKFVVMRRGRKTKIDSRARLHLCLLAQIIERS